MATVVELNTKPESWVVKYNLWCAIVVSQVGLIVWEFQQIWAPHGTFDWNDVLFTLLGGIVFLLFWQANPIAEKSRS